MRVDTKYGLIPSDDIDVYDHVPPSLKRYFGNILGAEFTSIDDKGVVRYEKIVSNSGLVTIAASTTSPDVGRNNLLMTINTSATTIIRFDYGLVSQRLTLIINDNFTTIEHNANIKLKSKATKVCSSGDTFKFICTSNSTDTSCVWVEI